MAETLTDPRIEEAERSLSVSSALLVIDEALVNYSSHETADAEEFSDILLDLHTSLPTESSAKSVIEQALLDFVRVELAPTSEVNNRLLDIRQGLLSG